MLQLLAKNELGLEIRCDNSFNTNQFHMLILLTF